MFTKSYFAMTLSLFKAIPGVKRRVFLESGIRLNQDASWSDPETD